MNGFPKQGQRPFLATSIPISYNGFVSETLLQPKLFIPVTRTGVVLRPQLLTRLNEGLNGRLTLISAPAGFGKTTLVTQWLTQLSERQSKNDNELKLAWLSLDVNDNEVVRFFTYVVAALQKINGRLGQSTLEMLQSTAANEVQNIVTELLNSLLQTSHNILLALDDYHQINNPTIHEGLQFLLEHAPPTFHLLLIGRSDPPLPLARLRLHRQMMEIRQDDLRFTPQETHQFLNQLMMLALPETAVSALEQRTEGWPAGLQMAAFSLQGHTDKAAFIRDFTGSHRYIFDYLTEEVLTTQTAEIRNFLLQTAVLDRFCAPLCDALLATSSQNDPPQSTTSQPILEQLEAANLFLMPLDDERRWYRYHQLFADLLRQQLRREQPELEKEMHRRASEWFEQANFKDEAINHALATDDYERAATLVAQFSDFLIRQGDFNKLLAWIGRLPTEWQRHHPQLIINHAWALLFRSSSQEMEATLAHLPPEIATSLPYSAYLLVLRGVFALRRGLTDDAIALAQESESMLVSLEQTAATLNNRGVSAIIFATGIRVKDSQQALDAYQTAVSLNRQSGNKITLLTAVRGWGTLLVELGQLHQAEKVFLQGVQLEQQWVAHAGRPGQKLLVAAPLHVSLGQLYYEWNQLEKAASHLERAASLLTHSGPVNHSEGLAALIHLRLAQENHNAIEPLLTQLEVLQEEANSQFARQQLTIALAGVRAALYRQAAEPKWQHTLVQLLPQLGKESSQAVLARARLLLCLAQPKEAVSLLAEFATELKENGRTGLWLSAKVLLCQAQHRFGEADKALAGLQEAFSIAEPEGYVRLFVDGGTEMARLLETAVQQNIAPAYATKLLQQFQIEEPTNRQSPIQNRQLLSARETEVLQLIVQGLTNKEIGTKLFIAPSTVKRHSINIYNKLDVNGRTEATARAYELGLV